MNKRELLEEKKKNWMSDRAISRIKEEISQEVFQKKSQINNINEKKSLKSDVQVQNNISTTVTAENTDHFLNKLTEKLTSHIREEIKKEMSTTIHNEDIRETVASKMDSYLQAELGTHLCKICFELMTSPLNTPILLFPCGHTFCGDCSAKQRTQCYICRSTIKDRQKLFFM